MLALQRDPCFLALTRPPMKWGIPVKGFGVAVLGSTAAAMWVFRNPLYGPPIFGALCLPMRFFASRDHNFVRVWQLWLETKGSAGADIEQWGGSTLAALPLRLRSVKRVMSSA